MLFAISSTIYSKSIYLHFLNCFKYYCIPFREANTISKSISLNCFKPNKLLNSLTWLLNRFKFFFLNFNILGRNYLLGGNDWLQINFNLLLFFFFLQKALRFFINFLYWQLKFIEFFIKLLLDPFDLIIKILIVNFSRHDLIIYSQINFIS